MKRTKGEVAFQAFTVLLLAAVSLSFIPPFLIVLASSMVSESELIRRGNFILIPEKLDFSAYVVLLSKGSLLLNAYKITILRVAAGTFLNLVFTSMMAYGLSRRNLPLRNVLIS
ncbi:MAG: transporter permease, partial [Paenibacillus sp.]|nr:transporter permease [Paenibacillus sp.]